MTFVFLQACSNVTGVQDAFDAILNGNFTDGFLCQFINPLGLLGFGLLAYGAIGAMLYVRTDSVAIPFALLILLSGGIVSQIAGIGIAVVTVVALVLLGGIPVVLIDRYGRPG